MMDGFQILVLVILSGGFLLLSWFLRQQNRSPQDSEVKNLIQEKTKIESNLEQTEKELIKTQAELDSEKGDKKELEGKGKQLFAEITGYKEENKNLRVDRDELKEKIATFESEKNQREKDFERKSDQLENARKKLEAEQERVQREDEEKLAEEKGEWDRLWNEHENMVLHVLRDTCQNSAIGFSYYENTKLPSDFDGKLKPDFLVNFLGQYMIFDAKKSKDLGNYINDQVKKTAMKIQKSKNKSKIYPVAFFVVPSGELTNLKKTFFYEEGFSFFIIGKESIESILSAYKRITEYEQISEFDPQDRERIIDLIARYDRHISFQNAANILLAQEGVNVMNQKGGINEDVREEVEVKKKNMRPPRLNESDLKRLAQNLEEQEKDIDALIAPKTPISEKDLKEVQKSLL